MTEPHYDAIIIGSGAGGSACAFNLIQGGKRVLMLEKGDFLPKDGSTLAVDQVFGSSRFKNKQPWLDSQNKELTPGEFYNVGGKTKWYGAALLRFSPHEFNADPDYDCLGWPINYAELEPFYQQAEQLLAVKPFAHEKQLTGLIARIVKPSSGWRAEHLPLGLKTEILDHPDEAKHFDGFASPGGFKADAEFNLLTPLLENPAFQLLTGKEVTSLIAKAERPTYIQGVLCADGSRYQADHIILAAGAMTSPRILQNYLQQSGLAKILPSAPCVGANFKLHLNSALLAFSPFKQHDMLRKTALFFNEKFPHSTVQCLGWMDGELLATQLPGFVPRFIANILGQRAYGFFVTTEDSSSPDNRIIVGSEASLPPKLDYLPRRTPASAAEHKAVLSAFKARLMSAGFLSFSKAMDLTATAHALGSLATGSDSAKSVVDARGKVHGMDNIHVSDGSILPRSSRVNPGLTIYAWGLRLGRHL